MMKRKLAKHTLAISLAVCQLVLVSAALAQAPPAPERPDESTIPPADNIDLSKVPVPEADRKVEDVWTPEEKKGAKMYLTIMPVGFVPPPIIYLDKAGMPREKYRNPLEFAPVSYHIKTKRGSIRLLSGQNNLGSPTLVPRRETLTLFREVPVSDDAASEDRKRGPKLSEAGNLRIPKSMTHGLVIVTKDPASKYWRDLSVRLIDVSPSAKKSDEVMIVNTSRSSLGIGQLGKYKGYKAGTFTRHTLKASKNGATYYTLAASTGTEWQQVTQTGKRIRPHEQILFLAWTVPKSKTIPTGAEITTLRYRAKKLPSRKPRPE